MSYHFVFLCQHTSINKRVKQILYKQFPFILFNINLFIRQLNIKNMLNKKNKKIDFPIEIFYNLAL